MTNDRIDYDGLIERLKAAPEPADDLDAAIADALALWRPSADGKSQTCEYYTASVDSALALVERKMETAVMDVHQCCGGHAWKVTLTDGAFCIEAGAPTLPLAILVALLTALRDMS